ncbi:hypothetical protein OF83DRAFT_1086173 [Amylostereum chailletii]|nr:hypothetical protein OF83DRAFT_1086173 [Amylostereum chailletii]
MQTRTISISTDIPLDFQTISLPGSAQGHVRRGPPQSISQVRASFAKHVNKTFALPGPSDIPEDSFVPHLIYPTSNDDNELDPNQTLQSIEGDLNGNAKILFKIDKDLKGDIAPRCSFELGSEIERLGQQNYELKDNLASARRHELILEEEAVETQRSNRKTYKKGKKGGRNGKSSPGLHETGNAVELAASVMMLQAGLAQEKMARKADLEDERRDRKEEMEQVKAQHAEELASRDKEIASMKCKLQDLYTDNCALREAFTEDDRDARNYLTRRVLLDYGREYIRETIYGLPKSTDWKAWEEFAQGQGFDSVDDFVAETVILCQKRGVALSEDALRAIWQSKMRAAGNKVAHGSATKRHHCEQAITTLPKNSIERSVLTEIFVCKFGDAPAT